MVRYYAVRAEKVVQLWLSLLNRIWRQCLLCFLYLVCVLDTIISVCLHFSDLHVYIVFGVRLFLASVEDRRAQN